jgi:hypothetical protein
MPRCAGEEGDDDKKVRRLEGEKEDEIRDCQATTCEGS